MPLDPLTQIDDRGGIIRPITGWRYGKILCQIWPILDIINGPCNIDINIT
jgi:hypothetical protein